MRKGSTSLWAREVRCWRWFSSSLSSDENEEDDENYTVLPTILQGETYAVLPTSSSFASDENKEAN